MKPKNILLVVLLLSLFSVGCIEENEIQQVKESNPVQAEEQSPASSESAAAPQRGSYENPADIGEIIVFKSLSNVYEVSVIEVNRGEDALYDVLEGNSYNDIPPDEYEYMLVNMKVKYVEGDGATGLNLFDFKAFSEGVECETAFVLLPDRIKEFSSGDVMPGATKTGWLTFVVPVGPDVLISFNPNIFSSDACYINIGH